MRHLSILASLTAATLCLPAPRAQTWQHYPTPTAGDREGIRDVSGTSAADVWAVGSRTFGLFLPRTSTLVFRFDGTAWSEVPSPDAVVHPPGSRQYNELFGVTTLPAGRALAVGAADFDTLASQAIGMVWDGQAWNLDLPPARPGGSGLNAVDTTPSGNAWAAGWRWSLGYTAGYLARYDGSGWRTLEAPPVGTRRHVFGGLHAVSDTDIWAVGSWGNTTGDFNVLAQHFDGSAWTTFSIPTPGGLDQLHDVFAIAGDDVWAAGEYYSLTEFRRLPLLLHYDGSGWTRAALPPVGPGSADLRGIVARGPNEVFAAGTHADPAGRARPYMLSYDGAVWTQVTLPALAGNSEVFSSVNATPDGDVWAVGSYFNGTIAAGLTERLAAGGSATPLAGTGCPGTAPTQVSGTLALGRAVTVTNANPCGAGAGLLAFGLQPAAIGVGGCSGLRCNLGTVPLAVLSAPGRATLGFTVPDDPVWIGRRLTVQGGCFGATGPCLQLDAAVEISLR